LILGYTVTKIHGNERVQGVTISKVDTNFDRIVGSDRFIECDALLLSVGLIPENELTLNAGAPISLNNGPVVDNNLETTIDGVFACGNVLQVHDLVDMVTAEAKRTGKFAIEYINERYGKDIKRIQQINCIAGENVGYIKPDLINISDISKEIMFTFRVRFPDRRIQIQFRDKENNKLIYKRNKIYVIPSEMVEFKIKLEELGIDPGCQNVIVDVVPRPEVLIEED